MAGDVFFASLAGNYPGQINPASGAATVLEPPTARQGARRVWPDAAGRLWVSEWNAGQVVRYDPATGAWREWRLPGEQPAAYAVYVDDHDQVWLSDFGANAIVHFNPTTEDFQVHPLPSAPANVRQIYGAARRDLGGRVGCGQARHAAVSALTPALDHAGLHRAPSPH
jgi:virginiamycin B lyase